LEGKKTERKRGTKTKTLLLIVCIVFSLFVATAYIPQAEAQADAIVTIYGETYDGSIDSADVVYATARNTTTSVDSYSDYGTVFSVGQLFSGAVYQIDRGYVYFDTSSIPDGATIDNATLSLCAAASGGYPPAKDWNLTIQNGQPTYPHIPLDYAQEDYYYAHYSGNGGNISTSEMSADTYFNISLTATGLTWIDDDGTTKLILRSSADINYTAPVGNDFVCFYAKEKGVAYAPKIYVGYTVAESFSLTLLGPYTEAGIRNYDGINCTITRPNFAPINTELNGTYNTTIQTETSQPIIITSDVGNNYTRVYYLRYNQWYEDVYIFYPDSLYSTYYVTLVDYVGLTNGYLESILNVNGTDRIIERQKLDVVNAIPFILSWGTSYKFRLISDEGTYDWTSIIAGSATTLSLIVTSIQFPPDTIHIGDISLSASRTADITIEALYDDSAELTDYVYVSFTEMEETVPAYYTNNTGNTQNITWSDALPTKGYIVYFEINHQEEGTLTYSFIVPTLFDEDNPWDFSWMGDFGDIDTTQLVAVFIVVAVFGGFSLGSVDVGIVTMLITAGILIYIGWLDITWSFFTIVFCIGMLVIISIRKRGAG